jgi:hypothetical protein
MDSALDPFNGLSLRTFATGVAKYGARLNQRFGDDASVPLKIALQEPGGARF